jgi:hypothetical protein
MIDWLGKFSDVGGVWRALGTSAAAKWLASVTMIESREGTSRDAVEPSVEPQVGRTIDWDTKSSE